ncbi:MAG: glycosyltransferase family 39 protein [Hydrogenobacter sp.]
MVILLLLFLSFVSLLPNINTYEFRNEEPLRVAVAYEMSKSQSYIQPYLLGKPYFNKPPLFNWLILLYSHFLPWSELTARAVSLTFLLLCLLLIFAFSYYLFKNSQMALLSALIFLTFGNVLFFYGYLAEIDITLTFFVFASMVSLYMYLKSNSILWSILAGVLTGLSALLKGFPAYGFYFLTLLAFGLYQKNLRFILDRKLFISHAISVLLPALWLLNTQDPYIYLKTLFYESFSRISGEKFSRVLHIFTFPLLNFKDTLPNSLIFFISVCMLFKHKKFNLPHEVRILILVFALNYLPYLLSNSAGRYVLPLYPLLATVFSFYIYRSFEVQSFKRFFYSLIILSVFLRFLYGELYFPYHNQRESSRKAIAEKIIKNVNLKAPIQCNCPQELSVCLYVGLAKGDPIKEKVSGAIYSINCQEDKGETLFSFNVNRSYRIRLLKLKGG